VVATKFTTSNNLIVIIPKFFILVNIINVLSRIKLMYNIYRVQQS